MAEKQAEPETNTSLVDRIKGVDRRLIIIILLLVCGGLFLVISPAESKSNEKIAREKADSYMNSLKNCDYESYAMAAHGSADEIYKDPKLNQEDREKFKEQCNTLNGYTFVETTKSNLLNDNSIDSYFVSYKLETDQNNNGQTKKLMVSKVDEQWVVTAVPF